VEGEDRTDGDEECGAAGEVTGTAGAGAAVHFIKHGFYWKAELCPSQMPDYTPCQCARCSQVVRVSAEEHILRVGRFCALMIIEAASDLLLMEKEKEKKTEQESPVPGDDAEPDTDGASRASVFTEAKILVAARVLLEKLNQLRGVKRKETLAAMRDAYEWIFADERAIFHAVYDDGVMVTSGVVDLSRLCTVEVCVPFLVAAEASHIDAEWFREKIRYYMGVAGLTHDMLKTGKFTRQDAASAESKVAAWFRAKQPEGVPVQPKVVASVQSKEVPSTVSAAQKVDQWFRALKGKRQRRDA
jgi:hypothetical protein